MTPADVFSAAFPIVVTAAGARMFYDWRHKLVELGKPVLPPVGKRNLSDKLLYPMREPLKFGDTPADFYETHVRMIAFSGGYKTTLLAYMVRQRIKAGRPVVVLTGGDSDQLETEIRAHGGWVMRPESSLLRFNAFEGTPAFRAQSWAQLFPTSSEAKVFHGAFELAALDYFEKHPRNSVAGLKEHVLNYEPEEEGLRSLWKGMKEGYVSIRLKRVEKFLGDWIGDELSITECVRNRVPVMFVVDSKEAPDLNELAAALVWQGMCHAVYENGTTTGADLFVDEFGRLPMNLINNPVRTFRRNKSHLVAASHRLTDFPDVLDDMFHVNALGRMVAGATDTRRAASDVTWGAIHPTAFGAHALGQRYSRIDRIRREPRKGYFWLVDLERVQEVKVPQYRPPAKTLPQHSWRHFLATVRPDSVSGLAFGSGDGYAATWKGRERSAVLSTVAPQKGGGVRENGEQSAEQREAAFMTELSTRLHGPPEMPAWMNLKPQTQGWWLRMRFPYGALDEQACWHIVLSLKGKGKRPGVQFKAGPKEPDVDWQAYDLFKALAEAEQQGFLYDQKLLISYLAYVKLHTKAGTLSGDHLCEQWRQTEAKLCVRTSHIGWEDKLINSDLHWDRLRNREEEKVA